MEGIVDKNLFINSINNIRVFLSLVFRTDHLLLWTMALQGIKQGGVKSEREPINIEVEGSRSGGQSEHTVTALQS